MGRGATTGGLAFAKNWGQAEKSSDAWLVAVSASARKSESSAEAADWVKRSIVGRERRLKNN